MQTGNYYIRKLYNLRIIHHEKQTNITYYSKTNILYTHHLPLTHLILKDFLPSIFNAKCFNDGELPFKLEVKNTETAHLLEHILLEYLCVFKIKNGCKKVRFIGETCWNWKNEKKGIFHISVSASIKDKCTFYISLKEALTLFDTIMESNLLTSTEYKYLKPYNPTTNMGDIW